MPVPSFRRRRMTSRVVGAALLAVGFTSVGMGQTLRSASSSMPAELPAIAEVVNGHTEVVTYRGVRAREARPGAGDGGQRRGHAGAPGRAGLQGRHDPARRGGRTATRDARRTHGDSSASAFAPGRTARGPTCSTCGRPTGGPTTSSGAIMPCSTRPIRSSPGTAFGRRARGSTSRTPTWRPARGPR